MAHERRRYPRLHLSEKAVAHDTASGRRLGRVSEASGGGMMLEISGEGISPTEFPVGRQLKLTIVEPGTASDITIDVVIRYCTGTKVGAQFVTGRDVAKK